MVSTTIWLTITYQYRSPILDSNDKLDIGYISKQTGAKWAM